MANSQKLGSIVCSVKVLDNTFKMKALVWRFTEVHSLGVEPFLKEINKNVVINWSMLYVKLV